LIDDSQGKADISIVVVAADIKSCIEQFQCFCGGVITAKEQGIYLLETNTSLIAFVSPTLIELEVGSYPIVEAVYAIDKNTVVNILGEELFLLDTQNIKILIRQK